MIPRPRRAALFLVPDLLSSPGGIARHGRLVCRALAAVDLGLSIVALHDTAHTPPRGLGLFTRLHYSPCGGRRTLFIGHALIALLQRPSVVMVEHPYFSPLGWLCSRLSGAPFVAFAHGIDVWGPLPPLRRWALQRADLILCVSSYTAARAIQANKLPPSRIAVLHNCLDPDLNRRPEAVNDEVYPSLLTVARIRATEGYKGHEQIIRALPALLPRWPTLTYNVVGDGDGRPSLQRLAADCGVAHAVRFHGVVPDASLSAHYASCSIFVMPSTGEGFGLAFAEAMAHAKPVIAGNADASLELVRDGETGFVVDPADQPALVSAITQLLDDEGLRRRMGARGAEVVHRHFGFETFRERLLDLLGQVAARPPFDVVDPIEDHARA